MRTLSLGVLIVCGGTLAALPFRRHQAIPDASSRPGQVTGPAHSALQSSEPVDPPGDLDRLPSMADFPWHQSYESQGDLSNASAAWSPANRRQLDIPLTYDDLAVPIDQPKPIRDRFSATAPVRQQKLEADRIAALVMPPLESLPVETQQELARVAEAIISPQQVLSQDPSAARAAGRLASGSNPESNRRAGETSFHATDRSLSQSSSNAERERFWIRQPN